MLVGEVEVGKYVRLSLLQKFCCLMAERADLINCEVIQLAHELRVALGEHCLEDSEYRTPFLPGRRAPGGVAHQVDDAALPCRPREDLLDGAPQSLAGVARDAQHARDAALAKRYEEASLALVGLGVDGVHAEEPAAPVGTGADGRDQCRQLDAPALAALDVGGIEPDVGEGMLRGVSPLHVGHRLVKGPTDARDLARAHALYAHGLSDALRSPGRNPIGHHLGYRSDYGAVGAGPACKQVLRIVTTNPQLGDLERHLADAGDEPALTMAIASIAVRARLLSLCIHNLVDHGLGNDANKF